MKNLLLLISIFILLSGCSKTDSETGELCEDFCGPLMTLMKSVNIESKTQSNFADGTAKYIWYTELTNVCTEKEAQAFISLKFIEKNRIIPVEVIWTLLAGGEIIPFTIDPKPGTLETEYRSIQPINLNTLIGGCDGALQLRLQINFDRFETRALSDQYLTDLIKPGALMSLEFNASKQ